MHRPITQVCWEVAGIDVPKSQFRDTVGDAGHYSLEKEKEDRFKFCISRSEHLVVFYDLAILTS